MKESDKVTDRAADKAASSLEKKRQSNRHSGGDLATDRASKKETDKAAASLERENGFSWLVKATRRPTELLAKRCHLLEESDPASDRAAGKTSGVVS
jgi:hypothetical protein